MNSKSIFFVLLIFTTLPFLISGQKAQLKQGDIYFEAENYAQALKSYIAYKKTEKDPGLLIKRGICFLKTNQPDDCIKDMASAHKLKSLDNSRFKYSAMAYFAKGDYVEAARFYKTYLYTLKAYSPEWQNIVNELKRCGYAINKKYSPQSAFVENLGGNVNTEFDEIRPLQSPTKMERFYFSSARSESTGGLRNSAGLTDVIKGKYSFDIYSVDLKDGNWTTVLPFDNLLNSPKNEIVQDFNSEGNIMYYIKGNDRFSGELHADTFKLEKNYDKLPVPVSSFPFNARDGDKDLHIFSDSLILFSSKRPGGKGGYDIYYAINKNGAWSEAINIGESVNSLNNEISPYLTKNSKFLYFSSDKLETLGGYDIFKSEYRGNIWGKPMNLFAPINSPGDDIDINLSSDGMSALFSSNRISSKGGFDLFMAYFKDQITDQLEYTETPMFADDVISETNGADSLKVITNQNMAAAVTIEPVQKEFVCKPLFFTGDEDILNSSNLGQLKRITDLMIVYPQIKISFFSHYINEGRPETDLYFSIKRAEKIAEHLYKNGIALNRIHLFGCGSNFPLAAPFVNNIPSILADKTNKRIDFDILSDSSVKMKLLYDIPVVAEQYRDSKWDGFTEKNKGVTFRVQFAEVIQMLKSEVISAFPDIIMEKRADLSKYIYTTGNVKTFIEAKKIKENLTTVYVSDTKILPYFNGMKMSEDEILSLRFEYPELELFLK